MTATAALMQRAALYVAEHRSEFDPAKPGVFYGNALCDLLGGPDYQRFASNEVDGCTIVIDPEFGEFVRSENERWGKRIKDLGIEAQ